MFKFSIFPHCRHRGVPVCSWVVPDSSDDCSPAPDLRVNLSHRIISFILLLKLKGDRSAYSRIGLLCESSRPFKRKRMLRSFRICVLIFSLCRTFRYSHDLMAKKKAPMVSCDIALWVSVTSLSLSLSLSLLALRLAMLFAGRGWGPLS